MAPSTPQSSPDLVLVTGASGFIGSHCILQLLEAGHSVRGTLRTMSRGESIRAGMAKHLGEDPGDRLSFVKTDLGADTGWDEAMESVDFVLHVASPLPSAPPKHEDELIVPARDGALRVLAAASRARVKRVVLTSSIAAVMVGHKRDGSRIYDESDWSIIDGKGVGAYEKSKTLAERAAWDFVESLDKEDSIELATINPGLVLGPALFKDHSVSAEVVLKLMRRDVPGCPKLNFAFVDVRDVAKAHVLAMTNNEAAGKRFIVANEAARMTQVARILNENFAHKGIKAPARELPNCLLHIVAFFDKTVRLIVPELDKATDLSSAQAKSILGWETRDLETMVVDTAKSFIEYDMVATKR